VLVLDVGGCSRLVKRVEMTMVAALEAGERRSEDRLGQPSLP
jgi:hypothetical protein